MDFKSYIAEKIALATEEIYRMIREKNAKYEQGLEIFV